MKSFINTLLRSILYPSQTCLAEHGLEREEDPKTVEFGVFCLFLDLFGRHCQSNCLGRLQVLADVSKHASWYGLNLWLSGGYLFVCLRLEGDIVDRLWALWSS